MTDPDTATWRQINVWHGTWQSAEQAAVRHLGPMLSNAEDNGEIAAWWFVRKAECWRLRYRAAGADDGFGKRLAATLDRLHEQQVISRYVEVVYEPETVAFGGVKAMDIAHTFFHADSRHVLAYLKQTDTDHRRELGLLLGTRMLRAASLDWYEQGDVWAQVAAHREPTAHVAPSAGTIQAIHRLVTSNGDTDVSPLHRMPAWTTAYENAGSALAGLHQQGQLGRGLRAVLTHHLLFSWNRLGISAQHQYLLATTAAQIVFQYEHTPTPWHGSLLELRPNRSKVIAMTNDTVTTPAHSPEELRAALADTIRGRGTFHTPQVEAAFRTVPRHLFLPGLPLHEAYAPRPVVTRRSEDGTALSSASSPNLVAEMLEQAGILPGHRILEIGAATGINAALASELTGETGKVVTIEYDEDLAAAARAALEQAGYPNVKVIHGDGAFGDPELAPYDRIIVTAGAWDIATAWWNQLAAEGRMVVPLRLHESGLTRSFAFDRTSDDQLVSELEPLVCGFVPMRGVDEHVDGYVQIDADVILKVDAADTPDRAALANALRHQREELWTGLQVRDNDPIGHLDLWLLTHTQTPFGRLGVGTTARNSGLVNPAYRWAGVALYEGGSFAYPTFREAGDDIQDLGVIAHGPDAATLGTTLTDLLHQWNDAGRPNIPIVTARKARTTPAATGEISRPNTIINIKF